MQGGVALTSRDEDRQRCIIVVTQAAGRFLSGILSLKIAQHSRSRHANTFAVRKKKKLDGMHMVCRYESFYDKTKKLRSAIVTPLMLLST